MQYVNVMSINRTMLSVQLPAIPAEMLTALRLI